MSGDYSRKSFNSLHDFAGVLMQQGHPTLDADWNEFVAILERRIRAGTVDTIGRAVVPKETPAGFQIVPAAGPALTIGRGRMYVDGLLAENHGRIGPGNLPVFDRSRLDANGVAVGVLDEAISREPGDFIDYLAQPYLPGAPALPATAGPHLAYIDVWNREVTPLKDPDLLEPALGGIDTATRMQTAWQVRLLADVGADATCGSDLAAWDALIRPSAARLTTATIEFEDPDEPCLIPPGGGYRGLENQLYRVELHVGGTLANARFKWSRDNASVGATIEAITGGDRLQVRRIGRDSVLRFRTGDWVEVTDDRREFAGLSGDLRRVEVDEDANELRLDAPLSADLIPGAGETTASRHSRVIRWDQHGEVRLADGTLWAELDAAGSDGLIPVPPAGQAVVLEAGITVTFTLEPAGGLARPLDHWCFAARTAGAQIEILEAAPPLGVHHHYGRLAMVTFPTTVVDCRTFWPPDFGDDCACTLCVSAEQHNAGTLTIQQAIGQLPEAGGTVCLGSGIFLLGNQPVEIVERNSVRLMGQGPGSLLTYAGTGGAVRVIDSEQVEIHDLGVFISTEASPNAMEAPAGFLARNCEQFGLQRTMAIMLPRARARGFGLAIDGTHSGLNVADNLLFAPTAIGALADPEREEGLRYCALYDALIQGNTLAGFRGVALDGMVLHLAVTRIVLNAIAATEAGIQVTGIPELRSGTGGITGATLARNDSWGAGSVAVESNTILLAAGASGVVSGVSLHLSDNEITTYGQSEEGGAGDPTASCIRLVEGFVPRLRPDTYIVGNRIGRVSGAGISIEAGQAELIIKQNLIRDCAAGGVVTSQEGRIASLAFDNNIVERVGEGGREGPAIGVSFAAVVEGRIIGNTIIGVGQRNEAAPYVAGLQLRGAILLDISHNSIAEIGPDRGPKQLFAIRLHGPIVIADISSNRLIGSAVSTPDDVASWSGLALDAGLSAGGQPTGALSGLAAYPAYVEAGGEFLAVSPRGLTSLGRPREAQIRIDGNLITDARARSQLPIVLVRATGAGAGCTFTTNQCRRLAADGVIPVFIEAQRLVVANNLVRRESDAQAMVLKCGVFGKPTATVVGNITFGNIELNSAGLAAPWQALNVLG
jgi:hypothetical protein